MNEEVDPCDDFFEFACGNYIVKYHKKFYNIILILKLLNKLLKSFLYNYFVENSYNSR